MNNKKKICSLALVAALSLSACSKKMDCNIAGEHIHVYVNESGVERLIEGENKKHFSYSWTEDTLLLDRETKIIADNNLCIIDQNREYVNSVAASLPSVSREELKSEYVYGTYWGWGYGYNLTDGEYKYSYGLIQGYHYEDTWVSIPIDEYTSNKVRDITVKIVLYKIDDDGQVISSSFDSLDEVPDEYKYFKTSDIISRFYSEEYYLEKNKTLIK